MTVDIFFPLVLHINSTLGVLSGVRGVQDVQIRRGLFRLYLAQRRRGRSDPIRCSLYQCEPGEKNSSDMGATNVSVSGEFFFAEEIVQALYNKAP